MAFLLLLIAIYIASKFTINNGIDEFQETNYKSNPCTYYSDIDYDQVYTYYKICNGVKTKITAKEYYQNN